jgi:hypothetical protein
MKLKEKFHQWLRTEPFSSRDRVTLREAQCEAIADEFAIGFVKFINETDSYHHGEDAFYFDGKWYTHEEFLEIYKKEKGL